MAHQAIGTAMRKARLTKRIKSPDKRDMICTTVAPSTLRMPTLKSTFSINKKDHVIAVESVRAGILLETHHHGNTTNTPR
jgi:hypothetical protein